MYVMRVMYIKLNDEFVVYKLEFFLFILKFKSLLYMGRGQDTKILETPFYPHNISIITTSFNEKIKKKTT